MVNVKFLKDTKTIKVYGKVVCIKEKDLVNFSVCHNQDQVVDLINRYKNQQVDDFNYYGQILRFRLGKGVNRNNIVGKYALIEIKPDSIYTGSKKSLNWVSNKVQVL